MNRTLELPTLKCLRCGHAWIPRRPVEPKKCPKCTSPYWNKPKVKQSGPQRNFRSEPELYDDACRPSDGYTV